MVVGALPFVAALLAMQFLGEQPHGVVPAAIAVAGFTLGGLLPWLSQNLLGLAGNGSLRRRLAAHLDVDLPEAHFVGFSPGERLHVWHGETDRDIGFLSVSAEALLYHGDDYSWSLPREAIDHIDLTPVEGGLQRIVIRWHVPRETGRALSLESREATSLVRARRATNELYSRLKKWEKQRGDAPIGETPDTPAARTALGLPPTDMSGAQIIEEPPSGSCASILALGVIVVILIWRVSSGFFKANHYYEGILWAGLISVLGALTTGYLLHYLQAWEAQQGRQKGKAQ